MSDRPPFDWPREWTASTGSGQRIGKLLTPDGWVRIYARSTEELVSWMFYPGFELEHLF